MLDEKTEMKVNTPLHYVGQSVCRQYSCSIDRGSWSMDNMSCLETSVKLVTTCKAEKV